VQVKNSLIHSQPATFGVSARRSFLFRLHRHLPRRLIVILDRWNVHRKAVRVLQENSANWLQPEWLPPYAPDLNPAGQVWNHAKYADLANFIPDNLADLHSMGNGLRTDQTYALIRSLSMAAAAPTGELLPPLTVMRSMVSVM